MRVTNAIPVNISVTLVIADGSLYELGQVYPEQVRSWYLGELPGLLPGTTVLIFSVIDFFSILTQHLFCSSVSGLEPRMANPLITLKTGHMIRVPHSSLVSPLQALLLLLISLTVVSRLLENVLTAS